MPLWPRFISFTSLTANTGTMKTQSILSFVYLHFSFFFFLIYCRSAHDDERRATGACSYSKMALKKETHFTEF